MKHFIIDLFRPKTKATEPITPTGKISFYGKPKELKRILTMLVWLHGRDKKVVSL